jgi:hypothetical protein
MGAIKSIREVVTASILLALAACRQAANGTFLYAERLQPPHNVGEVEAGQGVPEEAEAECEKAGGGTNSKNRCADD